MWGRKSCQNTHCLWHDRQPSWCTGWADLGI